MSIDLSKATALSDQYGNIVQLELGGKVIWQLITATDEPPAIFEVAKQTKTTYAGETKYENEQFILFDIYPKKGGTVQVTYGGLTKTVKDTSGAEIPNAVQVYFGTFNGVSDSVATPASGRLTIEGAYRGYGMGSYGGYSGKSSGTYAPCITNVIDFGNPVYIGTQTFSGCTSLALTSLPSGVTTIGSFAFYGCTGITSMSLPSGITSIEDFAFSKTNIKSMTIPASVTSLGDQSLACYCRDYYNTTTGDYTFANFRMLGTTPPVMEGFGSTSNATATAFGSRDIYVMGIITVLKGCGETYKTAERWSAIADKIVEAS